MHAIEDIFQQQAGIGNMEAWYPSSFQGHPSVDVSNRYFTPSQHAIQEPRISFSPAIDPDNILAQAMGEEEFVHTEDNIVEYYEAHKEGGRTK